MSQSWPLSTGLTVFDFPIISGDECYCSNASCALNYISKFVFNMHISVKQRPCAYFYLKFIIYIRTYIKLSLQAKAHIWSVYFKHDSTYDCYHLSYKSMNVSDLYIMMMSITLSCHIIYIIYNSYLSNRRQLQLSFISMDFDGKSTCELSCLVRRETWHH